MRMHANTPLADLLRTYAKLYKLRGEILRMHANTRGSSAHIL